jgi:hypothetical protein
MAKSSAIWFARLLQGIDHTVDGLGLFEQSLRSEALIELAQRRAGRGDFGDWSFREPLEVLLRAYREEAQLTAFGRFGVRWDTLRYLCNLLRLRQEEENDAAILDEKIARPIFILGLPRSGTTFLHNLLAQDSGNRVPRCWETIHPYPLQRRSRDGIDRRERMVSRQFSSFRRLAPELPSLHPLEANAAQECVEITGHVMRSMRFDTTHYVPSYAQWLDEAGHDESYRFHKRFLQHLQHQKGPGQWVLKSPDHIFAFDALLKNFPDARFVFVHRDPLDVLASVAKLTEILRQPFARTVDRLQIGRQVSDRWALGARLLIEASENLAASPERVVHVSYRTLVREPIEVVAAIYYRFGLALSTKEESRMRDFLATHPNGGYGRNSYRLNDYGLSRETEQSRYRDYVSHFQVVLKRADSIFPHEHGAPIAEASPC